MAEADGFILAIRQLFQRVKKLEEERNNLRRDLDKVNTRLGLGSPWLANPQDVDFTHTGIPDERFVGEVTAIVDANRVTVKRKEATAVNTWVDMPGNATTVTIGALNHSLAIGNLVNVVWDGNNGSVDPATSIYHVLTSAGSSSAKIFTVVSNYVTGGIYVCTPDSTTVVNFEELGDATHALSVGNQMLAWNVNGVWYGLTRWAKTKS